MTQVCVKCYDKQGQISELKDMLKSIDAVSTQGIQGDNPKLHLSIIRDYIKLSLDKMKEV